VLADLDEMKEWYRASPETVFLQDADPLVMKTNDLVRILTGIRERFPKAIRITTYARAYTLTRKSLEELIRLREAGLDRLHVGLESGSEEVLDLVSKGTTREQHIEGGRRAKKAGFELSEYIMPGLGGKERSSLHADETASALVAIQPDFVRLRTTAVVPDTPLGVLEEQGEFTALSEVETIQEIRRLLTGLCDLRCRLESDHSLNLLIELRGDIPDDLDDLTGLCDRFLELSSEDRAAFILARRTHRITHLSQFDSPVIKRDMAAVLDYLREKGISLEEAAAQLRRGMV
jgi:hypothetical protein